MFLVSFRKNFFCLGKKLIFLFFCFIFIFSFFFPRGVNIGQASEIDDLSSQISSKDREIQKLKDKAGTLEEKLEAQRYERKTLEDQIGIFDSQIQIIKIRITQTENEIEATELEIRKKILEIYETELKIKEQKEVLGELIRIMEENDKTTVLEMVLVNDNLSDFFNEAKATEDVEKKSHEILVEIKELKEELDRQRIELEKKKRGLEELRDREKEEKMLLEGAKKQKEDLLEEVKDKEEEYQKLLEEAQKQQVSILAAKESLEKRLKEAVERNKQNGGGEMPKALGNGTLLWPVDPGENGNHVISAYFHDPTYPWRHLWEHNGVDFPKNIGSPVYAVESGVVISTVYSTSGYGNHIMILHENGMATLYAHLTSLSVAEGQSVTRGQSIGGVGSTGFSTGPHLHFTVFNSDGVAIDPLPLLVN
jgi:murein DD-endopeptidase MepM/ murein hydrolase activator NlpD